MIIYEVRTTTGEHEKNNRNRPAKTLRCFYFSRPIFRMFRHDDHGKWRGINKNIKQKTRSPFDANENITRRLRRPSFCHRIASRKQKRNPTFSIAMSMDVDGSFREVIRLKTHVVSLDSMPTLGQGSSWKSQKIQTLKIR